MKKLFALAIVAGMVFVSCGSQPTPDQVDQDQPETEMVEQTQDLEDAPEVAEEVAEEAAE